MSVDIVGIEHLGLAATEDTTLATHLAIMEALPRLGNKCSSFLAGRAINFGRCHNSLFYYPKVAKIPQTATIRPILLFYTTISPIYKKLYYLCNQIITKT